MKNTKSTKTNRRNTSSTASDVRVHTMISPKGTEYRVTNLSAFARRFNLDRTACSRLSNGIRQSHKNWTAK